MYILFYIPSIAAGHESILYRLSVHSIEKSKVEGFTHIKVGILF